MEFRARLPADGWIALLAALILICPMTAAKARPRVPVLPSKPAAAELSGAARKSPTQDDTANYPPPKDLALQAAGERKSEALARFAEGLAFEDAGETDKALQAFEKVLDFDPGEVDLASRVAFLLTRQEDYPRAVDVLKDAIKARPKEVGPYLQLAFLFANYLKKTDQALSYAKQALALDPQNIEVYQRLYETYDAAGDSKKAIQVLEQARKVASGDPNYWIHLGKLWARVSLRDGGTPNAEDLQRLNGIFGKAVELAGNDAAVLKDAADFFASSQQVQEAIPLYLKVIELQPSDANAREKLAAGFLITNQRPQAIAALQEIIKLHPEKYQTYELLGQLLEENARASEQENKAAEAKAEYTKAALSYEQSLLINPSQPTNYLRLAELLLAHVKDNARAVRILTEARRRFPDTPQIPYFLAIALRENKETQKALVTFEETVREAQANDEEVINGRFYFEYGAAAEQAQLFDKAAELFKKAIELDPANAAEAYNYLGFMWAEHDLHLDEAQDAINHALQIEPNNGAYLDSLGWLYYRQGKFREALVELLHAAQNLPHDDPVVFEHIGDTYSKLNQPGQAVEFWQKAVTLDPENKKLAEKIEGAKTRVSQSQPAEPRPPRQ